LGLSSLGAVASVAAGAKVVASFAPFGSRGVDIPIELTHVSPTEIVDRYQPGGVSLGENKISFRPAATAEPATLVNHESDYRITDPVLRRVPYLYRRLHQDFVRRLVKGSMRPRLRSGNARAPRMSISFNMR